MRLTHIKLAGFKSFVDPTMIHVPGRLVAVVGPNGCGKSNVIDAVRWVLGEASAKQLRGESMQDVIFNGAATRRPAPRASVELVFDNSDHSLQGPWGQYAEVSIKRQLTRQGESTYYINSQPVRRRDITDLFLGTGVGARGYAVIEQGMISRIIEARPEELRAYIEEAAGVSKYKDRRRETESRLKDTREHLQRLSDLQSELARQVEKLEKQAKTAELYQTLTAQLSQQQNLLDYIRWQQSLAEADRATGQYHASLKQQEETEQQIRALNDAVQQLREQEQCQQETVQNLTNRRAVLREQAARLEEQIRSQQSLRQRLLRDRQTAQAQLQKIAQEQQQLRSELAAVDDEQAEYQAALEEWAVQVAEREAVLPELEEAQQQLSQSHQAQQDELNRLKRDYALKRQQIAHLEQTMRQNAERAARLRDEREQLALPESSEVENARREAEILAAQSAECERQLAVHEAEMAQLRQSFQTAEADFLAKQQQYMAAQAGQQAAAALLHSQSQTSDFWAQTDQRDAPELWQHIRIAPEWQTAVSSLLAQRLQAKAVSGAFLPDPLPQGAAVWFDAGLSETVADSDTSDGLLKYIDAAGAYRAVLAHWLYGVRCVGSLQEALARREALSAHECWVTPQGHLVDAVSVRLYGEDNRHNLVALKEQHDTLSETVATLSPQLDAAEAEKRRIQAALERAESQHKGCLNALRESHTTLQAAQARATELLAQTNQGQLRREHIEQELQALAQSAEEQRHSTDSLNDDVLMLSEAAEALESQQLQMDAARTQQQQALKQAQLALLEANRQYGLVEVAVHKTEQRRQSLQHQLTALEQQALDWQERQSELALAYESDEADDHRREELEDLGEAVRVLDEDCLAAQDALAATQAQGREQYGKQQTLATVLPQLQAATQTALLQQQEALLNAKRFHENLTARGADTDALENLAAAQDDLQALADEMDGLDRKIQSLGAVNLAALQELEEARERDGYYRSQSEDVQAAIALLEEAIAQIDQETKTRFKETFDAVNAKVQTYFPTLFGGGEAVLQMIGDDLLSAGVSIMARPPGKKNSTIHLLSGGEKALTAMSLVFALFSLNPAPFCLLDEVDAPLDDANTSRFCNLVKEMSGQTQFLYISHNRLTMEMAEQLVGVTMQEKGVSRIVAVDIRQALVMAEQA